MKHSVFYYGLLIGLLLVSSCKKDELPDVPLGTISCTIEGESHSTSDIFASATRFSSGFIQVQGIFGFSAKVFIYLPPGISKGVHQVDNETYASFVETKFDDSVGVHITKNYNTKNGGNGTIVINEIDSLYIKGTFEFTLFDNDTKSIKRTITDGKFNLEF